MNQYARLDFSNSSEVIRERRSDVRMTIIRMLMMVAIAGVVVLAIVAESRFPPELRVELFKTIYAYP